MQKIPAFFFLFFLFVSSFSCFCHGTVTSFTEYVKRPDPAYKWEFVPSATLYNSDYTVYSIFLTSQTWLSPTDSNAYLWTHWVQVCVPEDLEPSVDLAAIYIDGGSTARLESPYGDLDSIVARMCTQSRLLTARLSAVPNQPVVFADDPSQQRRSEDAMIAWTWLHYVQDPEEPDWLARYPMTKASIKALDAIQEFIKTLDHQGSQLTVPQRFVTAGGSKRGWTSWMTGCLDDPRVVGIIPIVAPIPNLVPQMNEMWESLGTYSFALVDYVDVGLMPGYLNTPIFEQLLRLVDPITYQEEMRKTPKLVIVAWCDEFFEPDSARYYWDKIPGEKLLRVVPNADHPLIGSQNNVVDAAIPFIWSFADQFIYRPTVTWEINENTITVTASSQNLTGAKVWYSRSTIRDWRLVRCPSADCANPQAFSSSFDLAPSATAGPNTIFTHTMDRPGGAPYNYAAHLIELTYSLGGPSSSRPFILKVTSDLNIISRSASQPYPYPPCPPSTCACGAHCANTTLVLG